MNEHTHTLKQFDQEMEAIRSGVLAMGGLVERQLARGIALLAGEARGDEEPAMDEVGSVEAEINRMQSAIDQQCTQLIVKRQPAAIDLRVIMMITKVGNDLERIGDEAKKIAYKATQARGGDGLAHVRQHDLARVARLALEMVQKALDVFARLDAMEAADIVDRDEDIDASFHAILRQLISYMMEDPRTISSALEIVFMAKSAERIGDHAKNIAEAVFQVVKGKDVRHATAAEIRAGASEE